MAHTYSTYEAKSNFSELIRKVQAGQRNVIAYRGEEIAENRPIEKPVIRLEKGITQLEDRGFVSRPRPRTGKLRPLGRKPGALTRFLESRA